MAELAEVRRVHWLLRLIVFACAIYVFLAGICLFEAAAQVCGKGMARALAEGLENPFAGLAVGILATVLVQSSSVTTSTIVAMVGSGQLALAHAVPMVMGANVGTSITNTLVSLGHVTQNSAFRRAFAGATVHDLFNLLAVFVLLPLELLGRRFAGGGFLERGAGWLVKLLPLKEGGEKFPSPVRAAVNWLAEGNKAFFEDCGLDGAVLGAVLFTLALSMIIGALILITKNMKALWADRIEQWLNRVLRRSGLLGLTIGMTITALVQSSSITTSLLVPMFGAGVLGLEAGFPVMIGANIGTTITALLAATATDDPAGPTIALVHLLFNLSATLIFFPLKSLRRIPIILASGIATLAARNHAWVVIYIFGTFVVLPILGILIWKS